MSGPGGPLPQVVFLEVGAGGGGGSFLKCSVPPWSDPCDLRADGWLGSPSEVRPLRSELGLQPLVFQVVRCTQAPGGEGGAGGWVGAASTWSPYSKSAFTVSPTWRAHLSCYISKGAGVSLLSGLGNGHPGVQMLLTLTYPLGLPHVEQGAPKQLP